MTVDTPESQPAPEGPLKETGKEDPKLPDPKTDVATAGNQGSTVVTANAEKENQPQGQETAPLAQRTPNKRNNNRRQNRGRQRRQSTQGGDGRQRQQSQGDGGRQRQDSVGNQGNVQRTQSVNGRNRVAKQRQASVTITERVVILKRADMPEDMQKEAIKLALDGLKRFTVERNTAAFIKKEFDQKYGGAWHCVIGKSFGSFVTHEARHFAFFYVDEDAVLLYKTPA